MKIKVSAGTLRVLGQNRMQFDGMPTTAYMLVDGVCNNSCKFCSQSKASTANKKLLSRISWPEQQFEDIVEQLGDAHTEQKLKRACIQVVHNHNAKAMAKSAVKTLKDQLAMPTCISADVESIEDIKELIDLGADKVSIAIDAVTPELYHKIKGGSFEQRLSLLMKAAKLFPNRMSTHVIVGLGETEQEMITIIEQLLQHQIVIALFAFTPIKGTELESLVAPAIAHYRRIQVAFYLLKEQIIEFKDLQFDNDGSLIAFGISTDRVINILRESDGKAFETTGCDDCNRPYYNEKPGGIIYNYPRRLTDKELDKAIAECFNTGAVYE
jgi:biotin synthase